MRDVAALLESTVESERGESLTCAGCGNKEATSLRVVMRGGKLIERCDARDCGDVKISAPVKTGFAYKNKNGDLKLLRKNNNLKLAKQVRQEYAGDDSDEIRGRDT